MKIVNIIVILLSVCSNFCAWGQQKNVNQLSREEEKDGFQLLFDGQSLNNWINNAEEYFVEDGCIVKKSSGFGNSERANQRKGTRQRFGTGRGQKHNHLYR